MPEKYQYSIHIATKAQLSENFMPYVKKGGLFIATTKAYHLGDEVNISLRFFEETEQHFIYGKVVWINPKNAEDNHPVGVGIQFMNEDSYIVRDKIENYLAG